MADAPTTASMGNIGTGRRSAPICGSDRHLKSWNSHSNKVEKSVMRTQEHRIGNPAVDLPRQLGVRTPIKRLGAWILNLLLFVVTLPGRLVCRKASPPSGDPARILIIRADQIGDVIMSTAILPALRQSFPAARIDSLCGSWAAEIIRFNRYIDNVIVFDCPWWAPAGSRARSWKKFPWHVLRLIAALRRTRYDVAIDLRGDIRHIFLFTYLSGAGRRISNDRSGGRFLLTDCVPYQEDLHELEKDWVVLAPLGIPPADHPPEVHYTQEHMQAAAAVLKAHDIRPKRFIVVFNGGRSPLRHIPMPVLAQACSQLMKKTGNAIVIVGSSADHRRADVLLRRIAELSGDDSALHNLCGRLNLLELAALISAARLFIGTDSSVSHLAAAAGVPRVVVFGPTDPHLCAPEGAQTIHHRHPCCPYLWTRCLVSHNRISVAGVEAISAQEIANAAAPML